MDDPKTGHDGPEGEQMYSSTISLTLALDGVGGQRHAPAALPPGNTRYPLYRGLGGAQGRSGRKRKFWPPKKYINNMRVRRRITAPKSEWKLQKLASPSSFIRRRHNLNAISTGTVTPRLQHVCCNYTAALYACIG